MVVLFSRGVLFSKRYVCKEGSVQAFDLLKAACAKLSKVVLQGFALSTIHQSQHGCEHI